MRPEVPGILGSLPFARGAERLARIAAGENVHRLNAVPVQGGDVPEVGHLGVMVGQDARGAGVVVRHPRQLPAEHGLDGDVQAAVSGAHRTDP
ncbi:hypothetical protein GCM10010307_17580 [Streptomyces vastus]|uniref:Uncharacterized protein n=1 Tax=Streptomyces vastus TaxID=285451 RepID=A0ABN3QJB2_9ACTN